MKSIDKNIVYLGWVSFFTDFASSMVTILVPVYVVFTLQQGVDKLGITIAIATFVSYFFRIVFGYLSDRLCWVKPLLVSGYLISALTKPLLALTQTYQGVAAMRGLERMGKAVRSAPKDALISAYSNKNSPGKTFGFHKMMDIAGELCGAICIYLLLLWLPGNASNIRLIFATTLIPGLIAMAVVIFLVKDVPFQKRSYNRPVFNRLDSRMLPLMGIYIFSLFFMVSEQFMIIKAKQTGYATSMIPLFIIVFTLTQTLSSYYAGLLSDKIGNSRTLLIALLFGMLSMFALNAGLIWLSFVLLGFFMVISLNTTRAYISQHAHSKAFIFGLYYAGISISSALGAIIAGQLWTRFGFEMMVFFSLSGMGALVLLLAFLILKERRPDSLPSGNNVD